MIFIFENYNGCFRKNISPAGNRTLVSRVTGGDTHHYTTEEDRARKNTLYHNQINRKKYGAVQILSHLW